jgi:hypothetical protein
MAFFAIVTLFGLPHGSLLACTVPIVRTVGESVDGLGTGSGAGANILGGPASSWWI